jgi:hypothetical protein
MWRDWINPILGIIAFGLLTLLIVGTYGGGCPPNSGCWGPNQVIFLGMVFSSLLFEALFVITIGTLIAGTIVSLIFYFVRKPENVFSVIIRIFLIAFLVFYMIAFYLQATIVY